MCSMNPSLGLFAETINITALRFSPVGGMVVPNNPPEWNEPDVSTSPDTVTLSNQMCGRCSSTLNC